MIAHYCFYATAVTALPNVPYSVHRRQMIFCVILYESTLTGKLCSPDANLSGSADPFDLCHCRHSLDSSFSLLDWWWRVLGGQRDCP
mmetsp:Transcript_16800/g.37092  ORF Transcript_16800/g.37092 Transcript_16800/m.37092 type:complete len:87 (-) Transcript_16800:7-267(-)